MKKIYIITTYTGTFLSRLITKSKQTPYAHVSISLKDNLKPMYSFGRLHPNTPIFAGFVEEYINQGLYKNKPNTKCRVYSLEVSDEQYYELQNNINYISENRKKYKYDSTGLIFLYFNKKRKLDHKYVCSNFVADMLQKSGINLFVKEASLIIPEDYFDAKGLSLEYEGLLCDFYKNRKLLYKKNNTNAG